MRLFRKKSSEYRPSNDLRSLSDDALLGEFQQSLEDYERGVAARWTLEIPVIDDAMTVADTRGYLHDLYLEATRRNLSFNMTRLAQLDAEWQAWILERIPLDVAGRPYLYPSNQDVSKEEWWWWIEELDRLSVRQRSTL